MLLTHSPPAGGAALDQVLIAFGIFLVTVVPLVLLGIAERRGRRTPLGRLGDWAARLTGLPRWAALPMGTALLSGVAALVGVYWDVPSHIFFGRDEGPLDNPSHYPIYLGLIGIFLTGVMSASLAREPLPARTLRLPGNWHVPMGSVLITATGLVAVGGFPLDDIWHRLFGQDVTLWGPTHVLMVGGGVIVVLGLQLLLAESRQVGSSGRFVRVLSPVLAGAWLMGASAFLMEFDIGVPQFPLASQVVLVGLLSAWVLVFARMQFGPGATVIALAVFFASRALYAVLPAALDMPTSPFLPYIGQAVVVELVALAMARRQLGYRFALVAGLASGVLGMLADWGFSRVVMPYAWPTELMPAFVALGTAAALAGAAIGAWQHQRVEAIAGRDPLRATVSGVEGSAGGRFRSRHAVGLAGALLAAALLFVAVPPQPPEDGLSAEFEVTESDESQDVAYPHEDAEPRWVHATVTLRPSDADEGAIWLRFLAWQGGDFYNVELERVDDGVYRSTEPLPVYGEWKTGLRLHTPLRTMAIAPLYAPEDPEADAPEIRAESGERDFIHEISFLQRERKEDTPAVLWTLGYLSVGVVFAVAWALFAWCYVTAAAGRQRRERATVA
ncbi:hypothetical protein SAMN06265360_102179 [Haloechinothrix alba]|uniref:Uncharacterized protein n=1 Tax=Haloechinothrix alba TaxID=664784 RepID=A0A238VF05_9PSEU|nr:hypothetical protein [Haloechinothrix alba]SNR32985.1 hypothetical protein SAMN06265360_102179 [Haloechinothrix alba]